MTQNRRGWMVKQSFSDDFVDCMERLYKKYGEQVFAIQGIATYQISESDQALMLLGKPGEETRVEKVFGFFDSHEPGRIGIVEHGQVGKHFEGAVRGKP